MEALRTGGHLPSAPNMEADCREEAAPEVDGAVGSLRPRRRWVGLLASGGGPAVGASAAVCPAPRPPFRCATAWEAQDTRLRNIHETGNLEEGTQKEAGKKPNDESPDEAKVEMRPTTVKREANPEHQEWLDPSATFASRLPLFLEQCWAFQSARRTWTFARPCCLANRFLTPHAPPSPTGQACYQRLNTKQRRQFRAYVETIEANGCIKCDSRNRYFIRLLHPELCRRTVEHLYDRPARTPPEMEMRRWLRSLDIRWLTDCWWRLTPKGPKRLAAPSAMSDPKVFQGCSQVAAALVKRVAEERAIRKGAVLGHKQTADQASALPGVNRQKRRCRWRAEIRLEGKRVARVFGPRDGSPAEIEQAHLSAVQCRQDPERQDVGVSAATLTEGQAHPAQGQN